MKETSNPYHPFVVRAMAEGRDGDRVAHTRAAVSATGIVDAAATAVAAGTGRYSTRSVVGQWSAGADAGDVDVLCV